MARMELFGGDPQVPVEASLLLGYNDKTDGTDLYVMISTGGSPFGETSSIKPFEMKDGDLYGSDLREIFQEQLDNGGKYCLKTSASYTSQEEEAKYIAYLLEEFAAKFHQKALRLNRLSVAAKHSE